MKINITLIEQMLGSKPADPEVFATFIASKAPDGDKRKEEIETAEAREESGTTVFHRKDGKIGIWDYQIKGFFKDACAAMKQADDSVSKKIKAHKSKIDQLIFVTPRFIPLIIPDGGKVGICERPLRAETMMGPRVTLARSETVPAGTTLEVDVVTLASKIGKGDDAVNAEDCILEWLNYGQLRGLGQWRNSGMGRFTFERTDK